MTPRLFAFVSLLALACPAVSAADPHVDLAWDGCVGVVSGSVGPGGSADLYVSVLGQTEPAEGYEVSVLLGSTGLLPDAWRFDATGCQSGLVTINHLAPASVAATCPSFQGSLSSLQIKEYAYDPTTGKAKALLADEYPNGGLGNPAATDPAQRYFLADFHFDETYGAVGATPPGFLYCGGIEKPICVTLFQHDWLDTTASGQFRPWAAGSSSVLMNDPTDVTRCPGFVPVSAHPSTWGAIKSQYRQ